MNDFSLQGMNALVVGGTSGIGNAIAHGLAQAGAKIAVCPSMGTAKFKNAAGQTVSDFPRLSYGMVSYAVGSRSGDAASCMLKAYS